MGCPEGIPTHFDKIVLLFLLHKSFKEGAHLKIVITDYALVKSIFLKEKYFNQTKYTRIMLALKRWHASYMKIQSIISYKKKIPKPPLELLNIFPS